MRSVRHCLPCVCHLACADFATLIGKPVDFFTFPYKSYQIDFMAAGLVVACCVLLIFTTAGGRWVAAAGGGRMERALNAAHVFGPSSSFCFRATCLTRTHQLCHSPKPSQTPKLCVTVRVGSVVLCSWFNLALTGSQIAVILIILAAGFSKSNVKNMTPFLPYG